jgi:hypothetical protein
MRPSTGLWRVIVSVAVIGGGILLTARRAAADVISACVANSNGSIRIVADVSACSNNEAGLTWNVQGEPGPSAALHIVRNPHKFEDTNLSNLNDGTELIKSTLFAGA